LRAREIGTAVHYPLPIHLQPFYREHIDKFRLFDASKMSNGKRSAADAHLPVTEKAAEHVLSLPVHPVLSEEDLSTIVREVLALCA
jgi:perosamine synthetase